MAWRRRPKDPQADPRTQEQQRRAEPKAQPVEDDARKAPPLLGPSTFFALLFALVAPVAAQEMDRAIFHYTQVEGNYSDADGVQAGTWEASGWIGKDHDRLWWGTEGLRANGTVPEASAEIFYGRYVRRFWDFVVGYRHDIEPKSVGHFGLGFMGLAPYWFEVGVFGFVSTDGDPSVSFEAENDLFLTQTIILQPHVEGDILLSDSDGPGGERGLHELTAGLRTRWEIRRKLAPFVDVSWTRSDEAPDELEPHVAGWRVGFGLRVVY